MRIIAGKWRARKLTRPTQDLTRPMPDRVREAVFSILGSHYATPGELPALEVADLFAGGGSIGLEALSRGAARCRFFERDPKVLQTLRKNLHALQVGPEATIWPGNAWTAPLAGNDDTPFDLILLDPPYADARDVSTSGLVPCFLARWARSAPPESMVVLHHGRNVVYPEQGEGIWRVLSRRSFGSNGVTFFVLS